MRSTQDALSEVLENSEFQDIPSSVENLSYLDQIKQEVDALHAHCVRQAEQPRREGSVEQLAKSLEHLVISSDSDVETIDYESFRSYIDLALYEEEKRIAQHLKTQHDKELFVQLFRDTPSEPLARKITSTEDKNTLATLLAKMNWNDFSVLKH